MSKSKIYRGSLFSATTALAIAFAGNAQAAPLNLSDSPLFLSASVPPMNMLVMGRDHKLYYEAYDDHSDLNNDGVLDITYKPNQIDYYGYFDSYKCYTYDSGAGRFVASSANPNQGAGKTKKCSGAWSGDFLNYLTTSRMDALRKVLYGGFRRVDTETETVLERSHIPQDAHSWGKEYTSEAVDGYRIDEYSPLPLPTSGARHLFANTTPFTGSGLSQAPVMRVLTNRSERVWNWLSKERPVADWSIDGGTISAFNYEMIVRVTVCDGAGALRMEDNCYPYPDGNRKPIGLLQEFGGNDAMLFGLLTGSYSKNTSGGVLRRAMGSVRDEIDLTDGRFLTTYNGIITTLNRLYTTGFGSGRQYACGWTSAARVINEGECQMWGNPIAEMMYESLRYFSGKGAATPAFSVAFGDGEESQLPGGGLPVATWDDPYSNRPRCTKPFQTVVSDINPSYDTDQLPGVHSDFGSSFTGDVSGLDVASLGDEIWGHEIGGTRKYFIGQSGTTSDGAPTAKDVTTFANIRGLSPEEPTKRGGYYAGSVAYHGRTNDVSDTADDEQNLNTFAVALASPLPKINIPVNGRTVTIVPFAKSVDGCLGADGAFKATNQIVDFYVERLDATSGSFRVNFEDVEQGADHDMDAIVRYEYAVSGNTVEIRLTSEYAAGCIEQHMGYVISGTGSTDGIYLEVRDADTSEASDIDYPLDTPNTPGVALPLTASRTFVVDGSGSSADFLKDPLWYAAKWGGFTETGTGNNRPDLTAEWDEDNNGQPDNYFLVTNALKLKEQLTDAFAEIISRTASGSSASVNSGSISSESRVYQAKFNSGTWAGQLVSYVINPDGTLSSTPEWDAAAKLPAHSARQIITVNSDGSGAPFAWPTIPGTGIDTVRQQQLDDAVTAPWNPTLQQNRLNYIRGDSALEGPTFRRRDTKLGDVINSAPAFVGRPSFTYRDSLETSPYSAFKAANASRRPMVYVGANDGMLHGFDATSDSNAADDDRGEEVFAFVPGAVFNRLKHLSSPGYTHRFYVDGSPVVGDAFIDNAWRTILVGGLNAGGQGIYALDVTDPDALTEANASSVFKWEFTDEDDADLGYTYSQPVIARIGTTAASKRWVAIFGNGYNNTVADSYVSATGEAFLYVVDLDTGALIRKLPTGVGVSAAYSGGAPNGLASPTTADLDGDQIVETVYAGDLFGNLWKFDLSDEDPNDWGSAYESSGVPTPLFVATDSAGNRQPITSQVRVVRGPGSTGAIVLFGTGKFLEASDKLLSPARTQTLYGLMDTYSNTSADVIPGRASLQQQTIDHELTQTFTSTSGSPPVTVDTTRTVRVTSNNTLDSADRGWYMDLLTPPYPSGTYQGERVIANPRVRAGSVIFVTIVPSADPCAAGGKTRVMQLNAITGARPEMTPFDLNRDNRFNDSDLATVTLSDGTRVPLPVSSLELGVTYGTSPGIIAGAGVDHMYVSGTADESNPVRPPDLCQDSMSCVNRQQEIHARGRQSWRQIR